MTKPQGRGKVKILSFVRRPTSVDVFLVVWWLLLVLTGAVGILGMPSYRIAEGYGHVAAQYIVSGSIIIVALTGFVARSLKAHAAESVACFGVAVLTVCHAILFVFANENVANGLQTSVRLLSAAALCVAIGLLIHRNYVLPAREAK